MGLCFGLFCDRVPFAYLTRPSDQTRDGKITFLNFSNLQNSYINQQKQKRWIKT